MVKIYCDICNVYFPHYSSLKRHVAKKKHKVQFEAVNKEISAITLKPILEQYLNFDNQLSLFLNAIEFNNMETVYERICSYLYEIFPQTLEKCRIQKCGSTLTRICFKTSDLKLYMYLDNETISKDKTDTSSDTENENENIQRVYNEMTKVFSKNRHLFDNIVHIRVPTMPVIKFIEKTTRTSCKLYFRNSIELHKSFLIKHYLSLDPRIRPLLMIVKYWARHWRFTIETQEGKLTNYALTMLLIFYLQQFYVDLVPSVMELTKHCEPKIIDGWQVNFDPNHRCHLTDNKWSLQELLYGFFKFYDDFNFENCIICPIDGCVYPNEKFFDISKLPESMNRYKEYMEKTRMARTFVSVRPLCIQDPIELNYNCSQHVSIFLLKSLKKQISKAVEICAEALNNNSSRLLLNLVPDVPEYEIEHLLSEENDTSSDDENEEIRDEYYLKILKPIFEGNNTFDEQLKSFLSVTALNEVEIAALYEPICQKLNQLFRQSYPLSTAHRFGSTVTEISFQNCDLDIYLNIGESISIKDNKEMFDEIFLEVTNILLKNELFYNIVPVSKARVPIIKFVHEPTQICCDLSFNGLGYYNSLLIKHYLSFDPRIRPLMILVKYWAKCCRITVNTVRNNRNLTNYALVMLVIFYLQQPNVNIVPSVMELTRNCEQKIFDDWQVNFNPNYQCHLKNDNKCSIPELLYGFFDFYAFFNFEEFVVCPVDGCAHPKNIFIDDNKLPESMHRYQIYMMNNEDRGLKVEKLCIQDPIELNANCAKNVSSEMVYFFQYQAITAAELCAEALKSDSSGFLLDLFRTIISREC
ncbi:uncharacterized protein LOC122508168 [Leptopilina heterotoma]|uniref:uncharacterized protein LOC122508168 n=1 Tax=Leptopilina heterotoma TaxID=63436 RepID=UPI001CA95ED8|nr:uncharacterized protein LOC122508168 [Leptopilina heterotoma]XP_043477256.1 uncharacterized protein LOC122508168 [Leptopilina heterotoma]XP_043477257.1 uncharacterized protein LOC122508168 [Leptopilina heterotoma]